jgi:uncharacterized protein YdeI (YjbR/CyaY-like superfamily)
VTEPRFFKSETEWRDWLAKNHAKAGELLVGFHKAASGKLGLTYKQALDGALIYGWIDGVRRGGEAAWTIRFTPRKPKSIWSAINIARVGELTKLGLMHPAGIAAFELRHAKRQNRYSYENRNVRLDEAYEKQFRANRQAWAKFETMPPSYRRPAIWWVTSARREETRQRRLATLIADSEACRRVKHLIRMTRPAAKKDARP